MTPFKIKETKKGYIAFGTLSNGVSWRFMASHIKARSEKEFQDQALRNFNKKNRGG